MSFSEVLRDADLRRLQATSTGSIHSLLSHRGPLISQCLTLVVSRTPTTPVLRPLFPRRMAQLPSERRTVPVPTDVPPLKTKCLHPSLLIPNISQCIHLSKKQDLRAPRRADLPHPLLPNRGQSRVLAPLDPSVCENGKRRGTSRSLRMRRIGQGWRMLGIVALRHPPARDSAATRLRSDVPRSSAAKNRDVKMSQDTPMMRTIPQRLRITKRITPFLKALARWLRRRTRNLAQRSPQKKNIQLLSKPQHPSHPQHQLPSLSVLPGRWMSTRTTMTVATTIRRQLWPTAQARFPQKPTRHLRADRRMVEVLLRRRIRCPSLASTNWDVKICPSDTWLLVQSR